GITERRCLDLPTRILRDTDEARMSLGTVMREVQPDIVVSHTEVDSHPDHVAAFHIVRGAMLISRIVKIDLPHEAWRPGPFYSMLVSHMRTTYDPRFVVKLEREDFEAKLAAVLAYESQFVTGRPEHWARDHITERAQYFGSLARMRYGEPIMTEEVIGVDNLTDLIGHGAANTPKGV
ncbi:MAG: PIG-L deacetylase family protein, partial [Planctomycetota bacterium]